MTRTIFIRDKGLSLHTRIPTNTHWIAFCFTNIQNQKLPVFKVGEKIMVELQQRRVKQKTSMSSLISDHMTIKHAHLQKPAILETLMLHKRHQALSELMPESAFRKCVEDVLPFTSEVHKTRHSSLLVVQLFHLSPLLCYIHILRLALLLREISNHLRSHAA